jgi:CheY-like chemotaxis protein
VIPKLQLQLRHNGDPLVLVVEDDVAIATIVADELEYEGFRTEIAWNGARALERLEHVRPSIIILDLMLPVVNGWQFIEQYQNVTAGRVIPIIVISAGEVPRSTTRWGFRRFFPKPFELPALVEAVQKAVPETTVRSPESE